MTAVATHTRLITALSSLVHLADTHEPEWLAPATLKAYRAAVLEARVALLEAEPVEEPVGNVVELPQAAPVGLSIAA